MMDTHKIGISLSIVGVAAMLIMVTAPTLETQQALALVYGHHVVVVHHPYYGHADFAHHPYYGHHVVVVHHPYYGHAVHY